MFRIQENMHILVFLLKNKAFASLGTSSMYSKARLSVHFLSLGLVIVTHTNPYLRSHLITIFNKIQKYTKYLSQLLQTLFSRFLECSETVLY